MGEGRTATRAPSHHEGTKSLRGCRMATGDAKSPNNIASTFFYTIHMLLKDLRFEHGGAKLFSCPGHHQTSL